MLYILQCNTNKIYYQIYYIEIILHWTLDVFKRLSKISKKCIIRNNLYLESTTKYLSSSGVFKYAQIGLSPTYVCYYTHHYYNG